MILDLETVYQTHRTTTQNEKKMVFTAGQTSVFFEHAAQMGILHATVIQLVEEGINEVQDLSEFDRDALPQVADNLRCPGG